MAKLLSKDTVFTRIAPRDDSFVPPIRPTQLDDILAVEDHVTLGHDEVRDILGNYAPGFPERTEFGY